MAEPMFEILLFSAYLSAALISVVIAVYAISVSYLGRETSRSIWSLKKRQLDLRSRIKKFEEKIDVKELEKEIEKYKQEEADLKGKLSFLSLKGAVLLPLLELTLALVISFYGMYQYSWNPALDSYIVGAIIANGIGMVLLVQVLRTVEWAALRVPMPRFEVSFESGLKEEKIKTKETKAFAFTRTNIGDIMAEDVDTFVFFPPGFKVKPSPHYRIRKQTEDHPDYDAAIFSTERIHINIGSIGPDITVEAPEKVGKCKIPICIYERNTGESEYELFIEVE